MDRIIFGDNQFFSVNHISDEKSRSQSIRFKKDETILETINVARELGVKSFMCTTHNRMLNICDLIKKNKHHDFNIIPCMPYAHKYANAVTDYGIFGAIKNYIPGNVIGSLFKGGVSLISKDYIKLMELMIDAEMKMFKGLHTPAIFLQNVITDLLLGLGMDEIIYSFYNYIKKKYNAEPGFITMNLPMLLDKLEAIGIENPLICTSFNKIGFRMSGGIELYEKTIKEKEVRIIAMQVFAGGSLQPKEALNYICRLPNIESILFGASSRRNIQQTISLIRDYDNELIHKQEENYVMA
jgi:hypothetical protein